MAPVVFQPRRSCIEERRCGAMTVYTEVGRGFVVCKPRRAAIGSGGGSIETVVLSCWYCAVVFEPQGMHWCAVGGSMLIVFYRIRVW